MEITVLTVPDCPNAPVLEERLAQAMAEVGSRALVVYRTIEDNEQATAWGMHGSPTVLLDGVDPFAYPGVATSMSCRIYLNDEGRAEGAPSVAALCNALRVKVWSDPLGRAGAGRLAPVESGLRAVQQRVLRFFADHGRALQSQDSDALVQLHEGDFLRQACRSAANASSWRQRSSPYRLRAGGRARRVTMIRIRLAGTASRSGHSASDGTDATAASITASSAMSPTAPASVAARVRL